MTSPYADSKYTIDELRTLAAEAVLHGRWMIRADNDGVSASRHAKGFRWKPPGEWTRAPDFNTRQECGGGLHGQDAQWGGHCEGKRVVFCEHRGGYVGGIDGNKMKVEEARILLVGEFPPGLVMTGSSISAVAILRASRCPSQSGDGSISPAAISRASPCRRNFWRKSSNDEYHTRFFSCNKLDL